MASPIAGTSLGSTTYQGLLEFTWLDLAQGNSHMASRARKAWEDYGIAKDKETHYCLIRLVGLPIRGGVLCTFNFLPYGESIFTETILFYSEKLEPIDITTNILGTIGMMFGDNYIGTLIPHEAKKIIKWVKSVERAIDS